MEEKYILLHILVQCQCTRMYKGIMTLHWFSHSVYACFPVQQICYMYTVCDPCLQNSSADSDTFRCTILDQICILIMFRADVRRCPAKLDCLGNQWQEFSRV